MVTDKELEEIYKDNLRLSDTDYIVNLRDRFLDSVRLCNEVLKERECQR